MRREWFAKGWVVDKSQDNEARFAGVFWAQFSILVCSVENKQIAEHTITAIILN